LALGTVAFPNRFGYSKSMQRNLDLIRDILLTIEQHPHGVAPELQIAQYTDEQVGYHCWLAIKAGLAQGHDVTSSGDKSPSAVIYSLTWEGHEFLDAARNEKAWAATKTKVKDVGGWTFDLVKQLLVEWLKSQAGL
jgi:hypothetical protein